MDRKYWWALWWLVALGLIALCVGVGFWTYDSKTETVSIRRDIERAVAVSGLENKFIYVKRVFLGAGAAGGQGAPQVRAKSVEQFVQLVPATERIYTAMELVGYEWGVKKVYWAFIENRSGIIIWEDVYHRNDWGVENYSETEVTLKWSNAGATAGAVVGTAIGSILVLIIFSFIIPPPYGSRYRY